MHFSLPPAQSPAYPESASIRKNYFHAVDDQKGFGEVEVLPCSGRGDGEGEKAYHIDGRLCSGVAAFKVLLMSGGRKPTPGFCYILRMLVQTSWKQTNVISPSILLMILSER
jgi:hypothetical protein